MSRNRKKRNANERGRALTTVLIPLFSLLALFAVMAIFASAGAKNRQSTAEATPAPTETPYREAAKSLSEKLGGELVNADNFSSLAYKSAADGAEATVSYYLKSGLICVSVVRTISVPEASADPTEDIFGDSSGCGFSDGRTNEDLYIPIAEEIYYCLAEIKPAEDAEAAVSKIAELLSKTVSGEAKKAQMLYGVYTVTFSYSAADGLEEIVCEPA
jgi:hypothetical protein